MAPASQASSTLSIATTAWRRSQAGDPAQAPRSVSSAADAGVARRCSSRRAGGKLRIERQVSRARSKCTASKRGDHVGRAIEVSRRPDRPRGARHRAEASAAWMRIGLRRSSSRHSSGVALLEPGSLCASGVVRGTVRGESPLANVARPRLRHARSGSKSDQISWRRSSGAQHRRGRASGQSCRIGDGRLDCRILSIVTDHRAELSRHVEQLGSEYMIRPSIPSGRSSSSR